MAPSITLYDHTVRRFSSGDNIAGDTCKVMLCSAATLNAADTTLAAITKTEISGNGGCAGLHRVAMTQHP